MLERLKDILIGNPPKPKEEDSVDSASEPVDSLEAGGEADANIAEDVAGAEQTPPDSKVATQSEEPVGGDTEEKVSMTDEELIDSMPFAGTEENRQELEDGAKEKKVRKKIKDKNKDIRDTDDTILGQFKTGINYLQSMALMRKRHIVETQFWRKGVVILASEWHLADIEGLYESNPNVIIELDECKAAEYNLAIVLYKRKGRWPLKAQDVPSLKRVVDGMLMLQEEFDDGVEVEGSESNEQATTPEGADEGNEKGDVGAVSEEVQEAVPASVDSDPVEVKSS